MSRVLKKYSAEFRSQFIADFMKSGKSLPVFCEEYGVNYGTAHGWIKNTERTGKAIKGRTGPYTAEQRKQTLEAYFKSQMSQKEFAKSWGVPYKTLTGWLEKYRKDGPKSLDGYAEAKAGDKRKGRKIAPKVLEEIVKLKSSDPKAGLKYIQQMLARFKGIKVSTGSIKKTLVEAELPLVEKTKKRRRSADKVRFFERAKAMQLWQSDITSYMLTRHSQRVYLTVFMDDYSRYVLPRLNSWMNGGATRVLQSIQQELGIKLTNYHSLRASFKTHLLRNGMSVVSVQAMVGHRELSTTQRYIRLDATDLQDATDSLEIDDRRKGEILHFAKED